MVQLDVEQTISNTKLPAPRLDRSNLIAFALIAFPLFAQLDGCADSSRSTLLASQRPSSFSMVMVILGIALCRSCQWRWLPPRLGVQVEVEGVARSVTGSESVSGDVGPVVPLKALAMGLGCGSRCYRIRGNFQALGRECTVAAAPWRQVLEAA